MPERPATPLPEEIVETDEVLALPTCFREVPDPRKRAYLIAQSTTPSKRLACQVAGIDPKTEWNWRTRAENTSDLPESKAYLFALEVARQLGIQAAEDEAWERAHVGWKEPVFGSIQEPVEIDGKNGPRVVWRQRTGVVGEITKKSDTMLIFMLKGAKPETYRERFEHSGPDGAPLQLQIVLPDNGRTRRLPSGEGQ